MLDFAGSAAQHAGNLNCPLAVTRSACYFAVRVLTDPEIPPSRRRVPPDRGARAGGLAAERPPRRAGAPAVAAGNVETSSRVADLVLAAFGRALGQGTMNNLTLGNERFSYYETIGGGQGACADADGPSGVHVAMSNTLNTPIEALEREFPLRVTRYALRRGSGGAGAHRGGDGIVRELQALRAMTFSLIAERRRHAPRGADGGEPGAPGRDLLDGRALPGKVTGTLDGGSATAHRNPRRRRLWTCLRQCRRIASDIRAARRGDRGAAAARERIGFLGLGIMGSRMAANVRRAGFPLSGLDAHARQGGALGGRARRDDRVATRRRRSRRRATSW